ncbi:LysR family transcriptional regulator [Bacillus sp. OK048]|uniref:LysR family transcriptional regulator n=1 Tax=Bacillus sp. OK048 TaxID=1882761 RepID=UPI000882503C|nr:LysR family transcriptional regulator [Bacillus sp. OK048]SDL96393.1 DNA-binding transcriptional regulator, LysR family [Bacillus sp. OK048]
MDIIQLHYFIVAAEQEHMTKASEILSLSQSALSRSITSLESELGVPLFDRKNRKILLNRYGKAFLEDAKKIVNQVEISKENLKELVHPNAGNIAISFVHSLGLHYIPTLLIDFQKTNPGHSITLREDNAEVIVNDLLTNEIDFGFATQFKSFSDLAYHPIFKEKIVLITSLDHHFVNKKSIKMSDLTNEDFIHYNSDTELRKLIDTHFSEKNINLNIAYDGLEINSIIGLVAANMGVALAPDSVIQNVSHVARIPISDFNVWRTIYLIHKKEGFISKAALYFKDFMLSYHGENCNKAI